jgi:hypothetical protein
MIAAMTSENIKLARTMSGVHREILCKEAGLPASTWTRVESYGQMVPRVSIDTLRRVEQIFWRHGIAFMPSGVVRVPQQPTPAVAA